MFMFTVFTSFMNREHRERERVHDVHDFVHGVHDFGVVDLGGTFRFFSRTARRAYGSTKD